MQKASCRYKLTYFNIPGRAELSRLILSAAKEPFEDNRIEFSEWAEFKKKTPHGYLPLLWTEVDGCTLDQSQTIARFLSKRFGFHGENDIEGAFVETYMDICLDLFLKVANIRYENDESKKKQLSEELQTKHIPAFVKTMDEQLSKKDSDGYLVLRKLTTADFALYATVSMIKSNELGVVSEIVDKHFKMVEDVPGIKDYVTNHPSPKMG